MPAVLQSVLELAKSENPMHRESALTIFGTLVSLMGQELKQYFDTIYQVIVAGLNDSNVKVTYYFLLIV